MQAVGTIFSKGIKMQRRTFGLLVKSSSNQSSTKEHHFCGAQESSLQIYAPFRLMLCYNIGLMGGQRSYANWKFAARHLGYSPESMNSCTCFCENVTS